MDLTHVGIFGNFRQSWQRMMQRNGRLICGRQQEMSSCLTVASTNHVRLLALTCSVGNDFGKQLVHKSAQEQH